MNKKLQFLVILFSILFIHPIFGQERKISGIVTDTDNEPLAGVTVRIDQTVTGTITDADGNFSLSATRGQVLIFSYVGYLSERITVEDQMTLNVILVSDVLNLEEIVVVGYGTMRKTDLTGSVVSISTEDLKGISISNADEILKGRLAGVQVSVNSGAPGGAASIRIRGASSINNSNEPLYIIDGIPFSGDGTNIGGFAWSGGTNGQTKVNPLSTIAPSDIVSIDVLKDASAAAIYGAAGANGVVIINTRRGEAGATKIQYDGYLAMQTLSKKLDIMNLREYAQYQKELGDFLQSDVNDAFLDPSILGEGTDWQNEIFRVAPMQSHQLSLSGGSEKVKFAGSGGYLSQDGIVFGSGFERYNLRFNADGKINEWLTMGGSLAYTHTDETITRQDGTDGVILQSLTMQPSIPVYNFDGTWAGPNTVYGASYYNPLWLATMQNNTLLRNRAMGNFYLSMDLMKDLTLRSEFGFDESDNANTSFIPTYDFGLISSDLNKMYQRKDHSLYWIWKNYATYTRRFAGIHNLTLMVGTETTKSGWEGTELIKQNFSNDDIIVLTQDGDFVSNNGWKDAATGTSVFGRLNYNYDERYLVTATMRADASSKFGPENKWGYFPSAAIAWRLSNESFLKDVEEISTLKLRLGFGMVGNSNIDTYQYGSTMTTLSTPLGTAYRMSNVSNPNLKWEASQQFNLGVDLGLWKNRVSLTVDLYQKNTKDLLMRVSIPSYLGDENPWSGIAAPIVNIGKTRNRGIDLTLQTYNVDKTDFDWTTLAVVSVNRNMVLELNDDAQVIYGNVDWWSEFQTASAIMVGQPMGVYYGYRVERLFTDEVDILNSPVQVPDPDNPDVNLYNQKTGVYVGDIKFKDLKEDGKIDDNDQEVIGDPNPDFTFGLNNTVRYKNLDLTLGIDGSYGADILNFSRFRTEGMTSVWDNQASTVVNRAQVENDDAGDAYLVNTTTLVPRPSTNDFNRNTRMSDRWIEDGSYLRISTLRLGYTLPGRILKSAAIDNAKIYATLQNVYTLTKYSGYDPEIGAYNQSVLYQNIDRGRYPLPRTFTLGLSLGF